MKQDVLVGVYADPRSINLPVDNPKQNFDHILVADAFSLISTCAKEFQSHLGERCVIRFAKQMLDSQKIAGETFNTIIPIGYV